MKKRWFYRLMFTFFPIFALIVSTILIIFFMVLAEMSKQEAEKASIMQAQQISAAVDSLLNMVDQQVTYELLLNGNFQKTYEIREAENRYLNYEVANRLKDLITITGSHSAYLFRAHDQTIISDSGVFPLERYVDKAFVRSVMEKPIEVWTNPRDYKDLSDRTTDRVISLVKQVPSGGFDQGILVLNVSVKRLNALFKSVSESRLVAFGLQDGAGHPFFDGETAGLKKLHQSEKTGYRIVGDYKNSSTLGFVARLSEAWLWVVIGIAAFGFLLLVYVIRYTTRPIDQIVDRIKQYSEKKIQQLGTDKDEFHYIENALDRMIEQSHKLEREVEEGWLYKKKQTFYDIVEGSSDSTRLDWEQVYTQAGLTQTYKEAAIVVFEIDRAADFHSQYGQKDQYLFKFALDNVILECAYNYGLKVWAEWTDVNQLTVITQILPDGTDSSHAIIEQWCDFARHWVEKNLKFTLTVGVGECVTRMEDLPLSYESAVTALKFKSTLGTNQVIGFWSLEHAGTKELFDQVAGVRNIAQQFCSGDAKWKDELAALFVHLRSMLLSRNELANLFHYMQFTILNRISEMNEEYRETWRRIQPELESLLGGFETLDDLDKGINGILSAGAEQMNALRTDRNVSQTMVDVRSYIQAHLSDPNLSLQMVSDHFDMTQSMLSRLFKNEFGEKFVDHLARMRMEEAKRLLRESDTSVQDIAARIGYNHTFSFIRAFKKLEGLTPGDFRKLSGDHR